ncbi:MAG: alkaline phosphatase [Flavihumibacter sp.]
MKRFSAFLLLLTWQQWLFSQSLPVTTSRAHSHNDYEQAQPFFEAWRNGFGSIEADIFLAGNELLVAHDQAGLAKKRTLEDLYLKPLDSIMALNNGYPYPQTDQPLQLMIDIKTAAEPSLQALTALLQTHPRLIAARNLQIVISGNRPSPDRWPAYPAWIWFDGELNKTYSTEALARIPMFSDDFHRYVAWKGKGRPNQQEQHTIDSLINAVHAKGKKIRFWNAPDMINAWYAFLKWNADYINTDQVAVFGNFLRQYPMRHYGPAQTYSLYKPTYRNDGKPTRVKNVLLLIGDGTSLPQWYAGYTANGGRLNAFQAKHVGLSKTSSVDSYITDSAPGATAFSSGEKTNNQAVGVDTAGRPLRLLPEILRTRGMRSGLITAGDMRDATPASFYAHQADRNYFAAIFQDYLKAPVDLLAGACNPAITPAETAAARNTATLLDNVNQLGTASGRPVLVVDNTAGKRVLDGRGAWLTNALDKTIPFLSAGGKGFFLMVEGAQVDHGGHANNLPYVTAELMDFDQLVGRAMQFADSNGETLVIVTGDHETGGLTLTGGDFSAHSVEGQFSTSDHTAIPVPVFAYGPGSQLFDGVYENTAIHFKIRAALQQAKK